VVILVVVEEGLEGGQFLLLLSSCMGRGVLASTSLLELLLESVSEPLELGSFSSAIMSNYCIYNKLALILRMLRGYTEIKAASFFKVPEFSVGETSD
jgi:hypothetical protein